MIGSGWAKRHQRIRAHSATGQVAGAANYKHGLPAHGTTQAPTLLHSQRPCPGRSHRKPTQPGPPGAGRPTDPVAPWPFILVTNAIESMISICRTHARNVKRWRDGQMALRWCAAGMVEAGRQFRRVNGHLHLRSLRDTLEKVTETVGATVHDEAVNAA